MSQTADKDTACCRDAQPLGVLHDQFADVEGPLHDVVCVKEDRSLATWGIATGGNLHGRKMHYETSMLQRKYSFSGM